MARAQADAKISTVVLRKISAAHCHLDRLNLDAHGGDFEAMMAATAQAGVSHMLCIGVDLETFPQVQALAWTLDHDWPVKLVKSVTGTLHSIQGRVPETTRVRKELRQVLGNWLVRLNQRRADDVGQLLKEDILGEGGVVLAPLAVPR